MSSFLSMLNLQDHNQFVDSTNMYSDGRAGVLGRDAGTAHAMDMDVVSGGSARTLTALGEHLLPLPTYVIY